MQIGGVKGGVEAEWSRMIMDEVLALNDAWFRAWFEKDAAAVERMTTTDYVYVAPNGQILSRATILGIIQSPNYRLFNGGFTEVSVRRFGDDVAIVLRRWQGQGTFNGNVFTDDHRCTMVCARDQSGWKVVAEQASPITP
jgi:ketosteroid isomerase-like protein